MLKGKYSISANNWNKQDIKATIRTQLNSQIDTMELTFDARDYQNININNNNVIKSIILYINSYNISTEVGMFQCFFLIVELTLIFISISTTIEQYPCFIMLKL